jgi:hypothetical protein
MHQTDRLSQGRLQSGSFPSGKVQAKGWRVGQIVLSSTLVLAGAVMCLYSLKSVHPDPEVRHLLSSPSLEEVLRERSSPSQQHRDKTGGEEPSLVAQARAFAMVAQPAPSAAAGKTRPGEQPQPSVSPPVFTAKFKLHGTSYCPARPEQSMALILDPSGDLRWVRQGEDLGHVVIQQVKNGSIVCRCGSQTQEMRVEADPVSASVAQEGDVQSKASEAAAKTAGGSPSANSVVARPQSPVPPGTAAKPRLAEAGRTNTPGR